MFNCHDIDLSELNKETDPAALVSAISGLMIADSATKLAPARQWVETFFQYCGLRDVPSAYSSGTVTGQSLLQSLSNLSTNRIASRRRIPKMFKAMQVTASEVTRQKASIKVWPDDDNERAFKKSKLANLILDFAWAADHEDDLNHEAVLWALMTPAVFRKNFLDYSFNPSRIMPDYESTEVDFGDSPTKFQPKLDAQGRPIMVQYPENRGELVTAFSMLTNFHANWVNTLDYCGNIELRRYDWVTQNYNRDEEGYHPENLENISKGLWNLTPIVAMELALKQLAFGQYRGTQTTQGGAFPSKDYTLCVPFYFKPSPSWPNGREIFICNGQVLYDGRSRVFKAFPQRWHPYSPLCYERVPGRLWGTPYGDKLLDLQQSYEDARTEHDQLRRTYSKPKLSLPTGSKVERGTIMGNEQVLYYNPFGPNGGEPHYLNAPQPPTTIVDDLKLISGDFTEMSGITEIRLGIRPQGVTTYRGLEVLREEASNSNSSLIRMYESFIAMSQTVKLDNIRASLVYPDPNMVKQIRVYKRMTNYLTDFDIQEFTQEDLSGHVHIEPFSSIGKSKLAMQEKLQANAEIGVLGDIVNDPDLNAEYKRKMDISGFDSPMNKQVTLARYENEQMLKNEQMFKDFQPTQEQPQPQLIVPQVMEYHDDVLHIRELDMQLLDPTIDQKPYAKQAMLIHRQQHQTSAAIKMMMNAQHEQNAAESGQQKDSSGKNKSPKASQADNAMFGDGQTGQGQNPGGSF